ncbi:MAG: Fatty acid desaturase [Chloroflexi bacterium ADurb.Bin360]|nr:MAG: Fatty acid desaturase [Chloroflexi bacterium ADurb.Bin360]
METVSKVTTKQGDRGAAKPAWYDEVKVFEKPILGKAIWQLINTLVPYGVVWFLAIRTVQSGYSYWVTLPLVVILACLMVRIFIFFHDCTHGSFFASRKANTIVGYVTGILTFTPFEEWRRTHGIHHSTAGDLDRRGVGDVWTMTLEEYRAASKWQQFVYRFYRNPFTLLFFGPVATFLIAQRFPKSSMPRKSHISIHITNVALAFILVVAHFTIGLRTYFLIKIVAMWIAGAMGIWLFYVQHQYEDVVWTRHEAWSPIHTALHGSSFYRLPRVLQWISGNIGFHHIHHVRARIPNYRLEEAYKAIPGLREVKPITLWASRRSLFLNLWDEQAGRLVSFREVKRLVA